MIYIYMYIAIESLTCAQRTTGYSSFSLKRNAWSWEVTGCYTIKHHPPTYIGCKVSRPYIFQEIGQYGADFSQASSPLLHLLERRQPRLAMSCKKIPREVQNGGQLCCNGLNCPRMIHHTPTHDTGSRNAPVSRREIFFLHFEPQWSGLTY